MALNYLEASAKRRAAVKAATVERIDRGRVFERDGGICGICHTPVDPHRWHLDHIKEIHRGGVHSYANVRVSHPRCNLERKRK